MKACCALLIVLYFGCIVCQDSCLSAEPLFNYVPYSGSITGAPSSVTAEGLPDCISQSSGPAQFHTYTTVYDESTIIIDSCANFDSDLHVYDSCNAASCISFADVNYAGVSNCGFYDASLVMENPFGSSGVDLIIAIDDYFGSTTGDYTITIYELKHGDTCDLPVVLENYSTYYGSITGAPYTIEDENLPDCVAYQGGAAQFHQYTALYDNAFIVISTCANFDSDLHVYESCSATECIAEADFNEVGLVNCGATDASLLVPVSLNAGEGLIIAINDYYYYDVGDYLVSVAEFFPGAYCTFPVSLQNGVQYSGSITGAPSTIIQEGLPVCVSSFDGPAQFHTYRTLYEGSSIYIDTCADFDSDLHVYESCNSVSCFAGADYNYNGDLDCGTFDASLSFLNTLGAGVDIIIAVDDYFGQTFGDYTMVVTEVPVPGDYCVHPIPVTADVVYSGSVTGNPSTLQTENMSECHYEISPPVGPVQFYSYTTTFGLSDVFIVTCVDGIFDVDVHVYDGCGASALCLGYADQNYVGSPCGQFDGSLSLRNDMGSGTELIIAVDDYFGYTTGGFLVLVSETGIFRQCNGHVISSHQIWSSHTILSEVPWDNYPACGRTPTNSPMSFARYTTIYDYGDVTISTCLGDESSDTYLSLYLGDCDTLTCYLENDDACGLRSEIRFTRSQRLAIGTEIFIGIHTKDSTTVPFSLVVIEAEVVIPPNELCSEAVTISNYESITDTTLYSATVANTITPYCGTTFHNLSPLLFYKYTTVYNYGDIRIDTCGDTTFDTILSVYLGSCGEFTCHAFNDNPRGSIAFDCSQFHSYVQFTPEQRLLAGTEFYITVYGQETDVFGDVFTLRVREDGFPQPTNALCESAVELQAGVIHPGTSFGSGVPSGTVPNCDVNQVLQSPVVFYTYTVQKTNSIITISSVPEVFDDSLDPYIRVFTGDCDDLVCFQGGRGVTSLYNLFEATVITIAVNGDSLTAGNFALLVTEEDICYPTGPVYQCGTSFTVKTSITCPTGSGQCAIIPQYSLGFCYDLPECGCSISKTSGVSKEDVVPAGYYEIVSVATNDLGFASDSCSFGIRVEETCNPDGPRTICAVENISLDTRSSCTLNGEECAIMPAIYLGTCRDYEGCDCSLQVTGPKVGSKLVAGEYIIEVSSTNEVGISTAEPCRIKVTVQN